MKESVVILYSGGLDSRIAIEYAKAKGLKPIPIWVNLGQPYRLKELIALTKYHGKVLKLQADFIFPPWNKKPTPRNEIIPGRNLMLATLATAYGSRIWITAYNYEMTPDALDKNADFYTSTSAHLSKVFGKSVVVETPFADLTKAGAIYWAINAGMMSRSILTDTTSCFHPTKPKCGKCHTCIKRYLAFAYNGIYETGYASNPVKDVYWIQMAQLATYCKFTNNYSRMHFHHVQEVLSVDASIKRSKNVQWR